MQEKTMKKLHEIYCQVCQQSSINAVDVLMNLKEAILNATFPEEDNIRIDYLLNKIEAAILGRSQTFAHTNMCTEILFGTMLIAAWINDKYNQELDVNITARRKSLKASLPNLPKWLTISIPLISEIGLASGWLRLTKRTEFILPAL